MRMGTAHPSVEAITAQEGLGHSLCQLCSPTDSDAHHLCHPRQVAQLLRALVTPSAKRGQ